VFGVASRGWIMLVRIPAVGWIMLVRIPARRWIILARISPALLDHAGDNTWIMLVGNDTLAHMMKWSFDSYYYHSRGHLPPDASEEALLKLFS
jgi:hypothetical protein